MHVVLSVLFLEVLKVGSGIFMAVIYRVPSALYTLNDVVTVGGVIAHGIDNGACLRCILTPYETVEFRSIWIVDAVEVLPTLLISIFILDSSILFKMG